MLARGRSNFAIFKFFYSCIFYNFFLGASGPEEDAEEAAGEGPGARQTVRQTEDKD